jgi:hypothetical protein
LTPFNYHNCTSLCSRRSMPGAHDSSMGKAAGFVLI